MTERIDLADELIASLQEGMEILAGTRPAARLWAPPGTAEAQTAQEADQDASSA